MNKKNLILLAKVIAALATAVVTVLSADGCVG